MEQAGANAEIFDDLLKFHLQIAEYIEKNQYIEAQPLFDEAVEKYPDDAMLLFYGSIIYSALNDLEKAQNYAMHAEKVILSSNIDQLAPLVTEHLYNNELSEAVAVLNKFIKNVFYFDVTLANDEQLTLELAFTQLVTQLKYISEMPKAGIDLEPQIDATLSMLKEILLYEEHEITTDGGSQ